MMFRAAIVALITLSLLTVETMAQIWPSTTAMTCTAAASLVASRGALVVGTGAETYERAVTLKWFCESDEYAKPMFAPTRDRNACFIGYYCAAI
jgi:hypothetical protein